MTIDFRALCAELTRNLDELNCLYNVFSQSALIERALDALAKADEPAAPAPPADGEVAKLVDLLRAEALEDEIQDHLLWMTPANARRAAKLLERQALVPEVRSEQPWEREGWCDELGRCWWGRPDTGDWSADWTLATPEAIAEFCEFLPQTVCLPAHALPLPEVDNG